MFSEQELYKLAEEVATYNKVIKDCEDTIKDNKDMRKDALVSIKEILATTEDIEIKQKYQYLLL